MRLFFGMLTVLLMATPVWSAEPALPITCKMVDLDATASLLGAPLGPPKFDPVVVCTGLCPSLNPAPNCDFEVANPAGTGRATALHVDLGLPPFEPGDWVRIERGQDRADERAVVRDIEWRGGAAIWYFRPDQAYGIFEVLLGSRGDRAQLLIILDGIGDNALALRDARALATHALARLERATPDELPIWNPPR